MKDIFQGQKSNKYSCVWRTELLPPAAPDASGTIHRKLNNSNVSGATQYAFVWYKIDKVAFYKGTERFLSGGAGAFLVSFQLVTNSCVG